MTEKSILFLIAGVIVTAPDRRSWVRFSPKTKYLCDEPKYLFRFWVITIYIRMHLNYISVNAAQALVGLRSLCEMLLYHIKLVQLKRRGFSMATYH